MTNKSIPDQSLLDGFSDKLQDIFIQQASKLINNKIYVRSVLSTIPVALIATDEKGLINTVNKASEEILGIDRKMTEGKSLKEVFKRNPGLVEKIEQTLTKGRKFQFNAASLCLEPKNRIVVNIDLQPIRDEERAVCGMLLSIEDQTHVNFLMEAFKRYVPPSVSEIIAKDPGYLKLGGEEKELTVLFSDLIGFTTMSEKLPPHAIVAHLGEYFDEMTSLIFKNEGTLKEYVADELMAIFGAPVYQTDHAIRACKSALAMSKRLRELRQAWAKQNRPELRARIGINTGSMLVGNLGSTYRFSYGVIGDQVNLGSRLEGLSSVYGTEILIGENTRNEIGDEFHVREIDFVRVKGRNHPVRIFELLGESHIPLPRQTRDMIEGYTKALSHYREKDWSGALGILERLRDRYGDGPANAMIERCRIYIEDPPSADWDGVFEHKSK